MFAFFDLRPSSLRDLHLKFLPSINEPKICKIDKIAGKKHFKWVKKGPKCPKKSIKIPNVY